MKKLEKTPGKKLTIHLLELKGKKKQQKNPKINRIKINNQNKEGKKNKDQKNTQGQCIKELVFQENKQNQYLTSPIDQSS